MKPRYEVVLYFNGPLSQWLRRPFDCAPGGMQVSEVLQRKRFRSKLFAEGWASQRLRGLENCRFQINPLPQ